MLRILRFWPGREAKSTYHSKIGEQVMSIVSVIKHGLITWPTKDSGLFSNELWLDGLSASTLLSLNSVNLKSPLISLSTLLSIADNKHPGDGDDS